MRKSFSLGLRVLALVMFLFPMPYSAGAADFLAGVGFAVGSPQGEFRDNIGRNGFGVTFGGVVKSSRFPFGIGIDIGFLNYGHQSRYEPLSTTIPDLKVRVENDNNIVAGDLVLRFQPPRTGRVIPYIDGVLGFKYLYTSTSIERADTWEDEDILSSTNFDDFTFEYGVGGGMLFRVYTFEDFSKQDKQADLYIDFRVRYMYGGNAEYLKKGSIRTSEGKVSYDVYESETDMLLFHLGVAVGF